MMRSNRVRSKKPSSQQPSSRKFGIIFASCVVAGVLPFAVVAQQSGASSRSGGSGGQCISAKAQTTVSECPTGATKAKRAPSGAPRTQFKQIEKRAEAKKQGPSGPSIELTVADRSNRERLESRRYELMAREIQLLERLVQRTDRNNPDRPEVLLRLAEKYFEIQQHWSNQAREFDQPIFDAQQKKNNGRVQELRRSQKQAESKLGKARVSALKAYKQLADDHPDYEDMDRVLFSLAFGLEEMRRFEDARRVYHRLIKNYPRSDYIPNAYLSFAEFYFGEGEMRSAARFYTKVTDFPPERNRVYGYALYKSAWAMYNEDDFRGALQAFVQTIEFATQNPDARDAENLARQSRRELVLPYAQVGSPGRALDFFGRYATDRPQAFQMLESLGELYFDTGQWPETIEVYHKLMSEQGNSPKICYWQSRVTNATISSAEKAAQVTELRRLIDMYDRTVEGTGVDAETAGQCKQTTAATLVWLATHWHREAVGTPDQPGTNDVDTMRMAARLYELVIERFPDMEEMEFPEMNRDDWPTQYKVAYYYAELLWKMEDWNRCGPAFDKVVEIDPQGEYTQDAAYASVLCYNNLYQQQFQSSERAVREDGEGEEPSVDRREFTDLEGGILNAYKRYVCVIPDSEELPTIKYRMARIYYEANHFEEAALLFRDVAWNHRTTELAEYAANLYLDCLNVLGSMREPARPVCFDQMQEDLEPLAGMYCADGGSNHPDLCASLDRLKCDLLRKQAEAYHTNEEFQEAAKTYVSIYRQYHNSSESCGGRMDEVLYNAAIDYEAAQLLGNAIRVRRILIRDFPESDFAKRSIYLLGANFHAIAVYDTAADYYEQFARAYPTAGNDCSDEDVEAGTCAKAHEALLNAVLFRIGMGQNEEAIADAELFQRNYKRTRPREAAQVAFSIGTLYERAQDWRAVERHYRRYVSRAGYGRSAMPQQIIEANVKLGKAQMQQDDQRNAIRSFNTAVRAYNGGAPDAINRLDVSDAEKAKHLLAAKTAASEALFYLGEVEFEEFKALRFPRLRGARSIERINAWAESDLGPWMTQKSTLLTEAENEYNKIAPLEVPAWTIAAAARAGEMYINFMGAIEDAPVPQEIENDEELMGIYEDTMERLLGPLRESAKQRLQYCLETSTNVRWFNEYSRYCEAELNRLDPTQYPMAAELRGSAEYIFMTPGDPRPVELSTGEDEAAALGGGDE